MGIRDILSPFAFGLPQGGSASRANGRILIPRPKTFYGTPGQKIAPQVGQDYTAQYIKKQLIDMSVQRADVQFNLSGTIIWAYRMFNTADGSPNTTASFGIRIADINADILNWYGGNGIEGIPFNKIFITNAATAGVNLEIAYFTDSADKPVRFF